MRRGTVSVSGRLVDLIFVIGVVIDRRGAADAGADDDRRARPADLLALEPGLRQRLVGGDDGELRERIAVGKQFGFDMRRRIEIRDLRGDSDSSA